MIESESRGLLDCYAGRNIESLKIAPVISAGHKTILGKLPRNVVAGQFDAGRVDPAAGKLVRGQEAHVVFKRIRRGNRQGREFQRPTAKGEEQY